MKCLTPSESADWLRAHHIQGLSEDTRPCAFGDYEVFSAAPRDARVQQRLARDLVSWIGEFDSALFWLTDWPFYQADEMALVTSLRSSHGEQRLLIEAPGHIFTYNEKEELIGWVYMFQTSHEDFIWLLSSDVKHFAEARRLVREYDLKIHRETQVA